MNAEQPGTAASDRTRDEGAPPRKATDEVDRIVAAWRTVRPDLDVTPLQVFSRISRLARHLDRDRAAAFITHGLDPWEFDVLSALRRAGPPFELSPRQLITETLVTSGTMTNRIDRLEARTLVRRRPDPQDGRGVLVGLTTHGVRLVDTALEDLLERERGQLTELTDGQQELLKDLLRSMVAPFDAE
jgi:DNA-binding MarR family transcriptional regulator